MMRLDASSLDEATLRAFLESVSERASRVRLARPVVKPDSAEPRLPLIAELDAIRAMTPPGPQEDSVAMIRALRDE